MTGSLINQRSWVRVPFGMNIYVVCTIICSVSGHNLTKICMYLEISEYVYEQSVRLVWHWCVRFLNLLLLTYILKTALYRNKW